MLIVAASAKQEVRALPEFLLHTLHVTDHCMCALLRGVLHEQLRSIAEAAMRELQSKVKEREDQLSELSSKLQEHQAAYLEQHARDRAEIEALSNKLFESGAASIAGLKANLAKASAALAATGDGGEEVRAYRLCQTPAAPKDILLVRRFGSTDTALRP